MLNDKAQVGQVRVAAAETHFSVGAVSNTIDLRQPNQVVAAVPTHATERSNLIS
jgi:hypothetical protein